LALFVFSFNLFNEIVPLIVKHGCLPHSFAWFEFIYIRHFYDDACLLGHNLKYNVFCEEITGIFGKVFEK
jgi:hypothetical protein